MVVSHLIWVLETTPGTSAKQQALLTSEPSLQPQLLMFFILTSYPFSYVLMIGEWPKAPEGNLEFRSREVEGMPRNPNSVERKQHNCSSKAHSCTSANSKATELLRKEHSPSSGQQTCGCKQAGSAGKSPGKLGKKGPDLRLEPSDFHLIFNV